MGVDLVEEKTVVGIQEAGDKKTEVSIQESVFRMKR
jgi:hypothetical protein